MIAESFQQAQALSETISFKKKGHANVPQKV
jgi:hypothetical protein